MKKTLLLNTNILVINEDTRVFHDYVIDINIQNFASFFLAIALKLFCNSRIMKNILLTIAVFGVILTDLKADFKDLPNVQEFEYVASYDDAINQLFNDQYYEFLEIETFGSQIEKAYTLISSKKKWFVKITNEDCLACDITSFNSEWILKDDKEKNDLMKAVNAELILPDKGAIFMFENKKHLIVSYPWAPGKTIGEIYNDCFKYNKNLETLKMLFYRYGQVLAISTLDPNDHSDDLEEISNRTPQILLDDRHEDNEKYFERNKRIYRLDLSKSYLNDNDVDVDTVKTLLRDIAYRICDMFQLFLNSGDIKDMVKYFRTEEYVTIPSSHFITGYISKLPKYNPHVIRSMLFNEFNSVFTYYCEKNVNFYCYLIHNFYIVPDDI